ncbi:MAG TPA: hypothetical protein VGD59_07545 [Acidisarcina sp.]
MKYFRKRTITQNASAHSGWPLHRFIENRLRPLRSAVLALAAVAAAGLGAFAPVPGLSSGGFLLPSAGGFARWIENVQSGSGAESALYRLMKLPGGEVLFRRSPRETRPALTDLLKRSDKAASLYSLRALEDEQALDFAAAEQDWKAWADGADDKLAANLDLADFYERRLRPGEELAALDVVAHSAAPAAERWTAPEAQRSWHAFERQQTVIREYALPREAAERVFTAWEQHYPRQRLVYEQEFSFLLEGRNSDAASALIARYRAALPADRVFPVKAEAELAATRGSPADGLAVYDRSFEPLWPSELVAGYYSLLLKGGSLRKFSDTLRARLAADPNDLKDAARLFYIAQQQGQLDPAKAVLAGYRERKDASGAPWSSEELYTLGRLLEGVQDFPEAARYYYALAAGSDPGKTAAPQTLADSEEKALAGLTRILLTAPEQPLRVGAGNLALYHDIATMDRGPGYLNGILSLLLNSQSPQSELEQQNQLAVPYFHRARAAELLSILDTRYPDAADRPQLHAALLEAYAAYGEDHAVITEGTKYLAQFPQDPGRVAVALEVADAYTRTSQPEKEFALYSALLKELAARAEGVPLGLPQPAYSKPVAGEPTPSLNNAGGLPPQGNTAADETAPDTESEPSRTAAPHGTGPAAVRSSEYAQVLDRYVSRLVTLQRLPDALAVLRGELDRNPQDPGLYERLAGFLQQNALDARQEEVYKSAIQQFQDRSWYAKLARFYLRQKRQEDYLSLSRKVAQIFAGTELEQYLNEAPAPDSRLAFEVNRYAHDRFPHDLTFVGNLLAEYRRTGQAAEAERLLWEHWSESPELRDQLFELLGRTGRLDRELEALKQQSPEIDKGDWTALAHANPAAERLWMEACLWQSHYEQGLAPADALAAEYPADQAIGEQASSLYRSLAYFHPEDTDKAVAIEKRLLDYNPGDLSRLARIGDIYGDRERFSDAAAYWKRMADIHPGERDGYLQSATVFWDYFDFPGALEQLHAARRRLARPTLFGYQAGAIEESRANPEAAVKEYVSSALSGSPSSESRERLLKLARKPALRNPIEAATAGLLTGAAPGTAAIDLRVSLLDAEGRRDDMERELGLAVAHTGSFDVLDALTASSRTYSLPAVEDLSLRRQIALTTDPVRNLQLRYQLVDFEEKRTPGSGATEIDAIYRDHPRIMGVVRATVDYDWAHNRRAQAVAVLSSSADAAYPQLRDQFHLEAARKLTGMGEYARSRALLDALLKGHPLDPSDEAAMADNFARSGDQAGLESFYRAQLALVKASPLDKGDKQQRTAELRRGMIAAATLLGSFNEAVDQYIELINSYPDDAGLTQEAALYSVAHGLRDKLFGFYAKTIQASPRDARWSIVLARLDTAAEDYPAAVDAYTKAIAVRPEQINLYNSRADLEVRLHRLDDAVGDYTRLYTLSYRDPVWMEKIAETRARQGRSAEAVKALETGWIDGRPPSAANNFEVATRLEQWGLLDEARHFAEQGVQLAGADLLVDPKSQSGAVTYARILARQRQWDTAGSQLMDARRQAAATPITTVIQQVVRDGPGAVTGEEWRKQRTAQRTAEAAATFAQSVNAMGQVAKDYYTPEEKAQFSAWLQARQAAAPIGELRSTWLPAAHTAGLAALESQMRWELVQRSGSARSQEVSSWITLEEQRLQLESAAPRLESLAPVVPVKQRSQILHYAIDAYRKAGDDAGELRATDQIARTEQLEGEQLARYYQLLLAQRPQQLVQLATADSAAQYLVESGTAQLAFAGVSTRAAGLPPVWKSAYTGLAGLYQRQHTPEVRAAFLTALGADQAIGDRIAHPADRTQQLAGEVWFYYGSRYGEYLDIDKDAESEGYLESELEHTPESPDAYAMLAGYSAAQGRADSALADYGRSLALRPAQPLVLDKAAVLQWKAGRRAEALAAWHDAVLKLRVEFDEKPMPASFQGDLTRIVDDVVASGQYASIREPVDALLRAYIARNGNYGLSLMLESAYHANSDSLEWLLGIANAAADPTQVLDPLWRGDVWIRKDQISRVIARILEVEQRKSTDPAGWNVDQANLANALLDENKIAEARAALAGLPQDQLVTAKWLAVDLRLAEAEGALPQLVQTWKRKGEQGTPASADLRNAAAVLSEPDKRVVMRFVYERALDARDLGAPNFLGLAAIDLDQGDTTAAIELLKRMTLVSEDLYADTDAAAALLEQHNKPAEAIAFLRPLSGASPWNSNYKVRLAVSLLATTPQSSDALAMLTAVANDPRALYADRVSAAKALRGHGLEEQGAPQSSSGELKLLADSACPRAADASKPLFVPARMAAAACATDKSLRERLLHEALSTAPSDNKVRLEYIWAAFDARRDARALVAAGPFLSGYPRPANHYASAEDDAGPADNDEGQTNSSSYAGNAAGQGTSINSLSPTDAIRLYTLAMHVLEDRHDTQQALAMLQEALFWVKEPAARRTLEADQRRLNARLAREQENAARAPKVHAELDQDRIVRPRLLPDTPSHATKTAQQEDTQ